MEEQSEATLLRREIASVYEQIEELEVVFRAKTVIMEMGKSEKVRLQMEKLELEAALDAMQKGAAYHDNPYTPPSNNSLSGGMHQEARKAGRRA